MVMKSLKFIFFILIAFLASCMEQKSQNKIKNNIVEVEVEEMKFPPQTVNSYSPMNAAYNYNQ